VPLSKDYNPFAKEDIHLPKAYQEEVRRYSMTLGASNPEKAAPEEVPFNRYIDIWYLAVALGIAEDAYLPISPDQKHRFITGAILQGDIHKIEFLMLAAIAHSGDAYIVSKPREMMEIAESYAAGGIEILLDMLKDGHLPALLNLTRGLVQRVESDSQSTTANP
jgi:hypothetical protein